MLTWLQSQGPLVAVIGPGSELGWHMLLAEQSWGGQTGRWQGACCSGTERTLLATSAGLAHAATQTRSG